MTKKQRIRYEIQQACLQNPVGAARTAVFTKIRQKYGPGKLSTSDIDDIARHYCYPTN